MSVHPLTKFRALDPVREAKVPLAAARHMV
jgi:hypothetical protein